jgi:hypothetical protein
MTHPYCVDCRFFQGATPITSGRCANPKAAPRDAGDQYVAPGREPQLSYASVLRSIEGYCGPSGKWFEEKGGLHG